MRLKNLGSCSNTLPKLAFSKSPRVRKIVQITKQNLSLLCAHRQQHQQTLIDPGDQTEQGLSGVRSDLGFQGPSSVGKPGHVWHCCFWAFPHDVSLKKKKNVQDDHTNKFLTQDTWVPLSPWFYWITLWLYRVSVFFLPPKEAFWWSYFDSNPDTDIKAACKR